MMMSKYFENLLKRPWVVAVLAIIFVGGVSIGDQYLGFSGNYRVFFDTDDERVRSYDNIQEVYSQADNILITIHEPTGVFNETTLRAIQEITEESWKLPYVSRVDSISNFQNTRSQGDDLVVESLVSKGTIYSAAKLEYIREVATQEPTISGLILSKDEKTTGVNITVQLPGIEADELPGLVVLAREMVDKYRSKYPDLKIVAAGEIMLTNAFIEATIHDFTVLTPLMFVVVIVLFLVILRSIVATLIGVFYSALCIKGAMGAAGFFGMMLTPPTSVAPTIILTIAVATYIHIYLTYVQQKVDFENRKKAVLESLRLNVKPIVLASATTIIGFLSMNFSTVPPFRDLGNVVAFGVVVSLFLSFTLLPAVLIMIPVNDKSDRKPFNSMMESLADIVIKKSSVSLIVMSSVAIGFSLLVYKNEVSEKFIEQFSHNIEFRNSAEFVNENLTGVYNIEFSVDSEQEFGVYDPAYFNDLDIFSQWLRAQPEVVHVRTFTDTLKRLNMNLNGDNKDYYRLPESRDNIAQYILVYEMSLPFGLDLTDQISLGKNSSRIVVTFGNLSTKEVIAFEHRIGNWLVENMASYRVDRGSPTLMFSHIGDENVKSMLFGTLLAFSLIAVFLGFSFRSLRYGLLSMLVNTLPILTALGVWALLVGEVGMGVSVVAGMTIGIVVDDTVHFINKYVHARRLLGLSPEDAVRYCFTTVGAALLSTTLILSCGFFVICFSDFSRNANMAQMNVLTLNIALLYDFVLLPSLILFLEKFNNEEYVEDSASISVA